LDEKKSAEIIFGRLKVKLKKVFGLGYVAKRSIDDDLIKKIWVGFEPRSSGRMFECAPLVQLLTLKNTGQHNRIYPRRAFLDSLHYNLI